MSFPLMHNSTFDYKILLLREPQNSVSPIVSFSRQTLYSLEFDVCEMF